MKLNHAAAMLRFARRVNQDIDRAAMRDWPKSLKQNAVAADFAPQFYEARCRWQNHAHRSWSALTPAEHRFWIEQAARALDGVSR